MLPPQTYMTGRTVTGSSGENITSYIRGSVGYFVHLKNSGANKVYIGTNDIYANGTGNGYPLEVGESMKIWIAPGMSPLSSEMPSYEGIHAITDSGPGEVAWFIEPSGPSLF